MKLYGVLENQRDVAGARAASRASVGYNETG
jgi:hypothetical protein